jgi:6-phosphogluconolactonase (cycloisomerase 2 family)
MNRLTVIALLAFAALVVGVASAGAAPRQSGSAVFVQTNGTTGNEIVAFDRAADGSLTRAASYATGGLGAVQSGAVVDTLASQGSLALDSAHALLFAVNAGSDTLSVFSVDGTQLQLRQVIPTHGSFPSSVSVHGNLVYVLNAGGAGSVQGYRIEGDHVGELHDGLRSLGLANAEPPFFLTSPGQVGFSPDGSQLIITTKGSTNSFEVFAVSRNGSLAAAPVTDAAATPAPFAFTFDGSNRLVAAEAGINAVTTYSLHADGTLTGPQSQPDGQNALCWIAEANGFFFVANAGSSSISAYTIGADGAPSLIGVAGSTETGAIDLAASPGGKFLYAESGGAGTVDVFAVGDTGSLTKLGVVSGLPVGLEGIAAS